MSRKVQLVRQGQNLHSFRDDLETRSSDSSRRLRLLEKFNWVGECLIFGERRLKRQETVHLRGKYPGFYIIDKIAKAMD